MRAIRVDKDDLIAKLQENRAQHRAIFEEAVEGYRAEALRLLQEQIERLKQNKLAVVMVQLPLPSDHTNDYDRVISMLDMSLDNEVTLEEDDFAAYVMDDWRWKHEFLVSNTRYSQTARSLTQG